MFDGKNAVRKKPDPRQCFRLPVFFRFFSKIRLTGGMLMCYGKKIKSPAQSPYTSNTGEHSWDTTSAKKSENSDSA